MSVMGSIRAAIFGKAPMSSAEVVAALTARAKGYPDDLNWRESIIDLLKLLDLDSGLEARKQLARELGYVGALDGSPAMNIWLHRTVLTRFASGEFE